MNSALFALSNILRSALFAGGIVLAFVAAGDWAVRTRRISPFGGLSRFMRTSVDPRLAGIERQVVRAGGHPSMTPVWALVAYALLAALLLSIVDTLIGLVREAVLASTAGAGGAVYIAIHWTFRFLTFALLVRVIGSWFPRAAHSRWMRWSFGATEWMLRPLRRLIPSMGMIDITPLIAFFLLQFLEGPILRLAVPGM